MSTIFADPMIRTMVADCLKAYQIALFRLFSVYWPAESYETPLTIGPSLVPAV
jgi:hypothetical protein